jgi:hypothetical protein
MDVIEEFERAKLLSRLAVVLKLLAGAAALFLAWFLWSTWREDSERTRLLLEEIRRMVALIKMPDGTSPMKTFSWIAGEPFASGMDDSCGAGTGVPMANCDWKWRQVGQGVPDPVGLVRESMQAGRSVVVISSAGHDDQSLSENTRRRFGTNFNLATKRSKALARDIVVRAGGTGCDEPDSRVHCVAVPQGAPAAVMHVDMRASARMPRLTVLVGG